MSTVDRLEILRDKIKCPQFGDIEYGEWGALKLEQRKAIKDLIDSSQNKDKTINDLLKRISNLEFEVEILTCDNESLSSNNSKLAKIILKAIEYIENHRIGNEYSYEYDLFQRNARTSDLLSILKGSDKE